MIELLFADRPGGVTYFINEQRNGSHCIIELHILGQPLQIAIFQDKRPQFTNSFYIFSRCVA